jgi:hypothetical protein
LSDQVTLLDAARAAALTDADAQTMATVARLIAAIPRFLRAFYSREVLTSAAPTLASECTIPWASASFEADLTEFGEAMAAFVEIPLADDSRFADLADWGEDLANTQRPDGPMSELAADFARCTRDEIAETYGDNAGCDALQDACRERDLLACNDLYYSSALMSAYESFGATCGERVGFGDVGFGGYCEELDA